MPVATRIGTPLIQTTAVDERMRRKLAAVSVRTIEELLGLISADPEATFRFLEGADLAVLQADIGRRASSGVMAAAKNLHEKDYPLGAIPPASIELEREASEETFEEFVANVEPAFPHPGFHRSTDHRDCMGPLRNQGNRGTCVAFATCAVLECLERRRTRKQIDLSEQFCYCNCKQHDGIPDEEGTFLEVAMPLAEREGICLESVWPYNPDPIPGNESQGPPPDGAVNDALGHKAQSVEQLDPRSSAEIRNALDEGRPVAISIPVYRNWFSNDPAKATGIIPMPVPTSVLVGGHAMCCVGYEHDTDFPGGGYLIVRNSWGEEWSPLSPIGPGYGVLPYLYVDVYGWESFTAR
jgi:hypothetical protein